MQQTYFALSSLVPILTTSRSCSIWSSRLASQARPESSAALCRGPQHFHRLHRPPLPQWGGSECLSAEVFVDDGMFIEACLGDRPQICVEVWELGVRLFLGITGISEKKLRIEGSWGTEALFLGCHINFAGDRISLPNPKVTGAYILLPNRVFDFGNCVTQLRDIQELRGRINHWSYTGRIWKSLSPPANQLLAYADSNGFRTRRNGPSKWSSFLYAIQFMREIVGDEKNWGALFTGVFSEIVGLEHAMTLPGKPELARFSSDATPNCIGGINWRIKEFFVADPSSYLAPILPISRQKGHISEIEFIVEVLRIVTWSVDSEPTIICGLTDNMCSNMRIASGKAKHGVALNPTRMFYKRLRDKKSRFRSYYIRPGRNISADFIARALPSEISSWAAERGMRQIEPLVIRLEFRQRNAQHCGIYVPPPTLIWPIDVDATFRAVEWLPGGFCVVQAAFELGPTCTWVDPCHSRIARIVTGLGFLEYSGGNTDFI